MIGSETQTWLYIGPVATYQLHLGALGVHSVVISHINLVK